jgi:hypothetical protein
MLHLKYCQSHPTFPQPKLPSIKLKSYFKTPVNKASLYKLNCRKCLLFLFDFMKKYLLLIHQC